MTVAAVETDRLKLALARFVRSVPAGFNYGALYPGVIIAPGPSGGFDFQPDDSAEIPGLQSVPVRTGIPGVSITLDPLVQPRCLMGFEGRDPKAPYLALWSPPGLLTLEVDATTSINFNAPVVALGPGWLAFLTACSTATAPPQIAQIAAAAATLLAAIQAVGGPS